jgi:outer membrane receptor protein involved in Fe transport
MINDGLTLSLGLRTENEKVPTYRPDLGKYALEFGIGDKIAPRLGASYDAKGDGRLKIYGSWRPYFDWTKYELPRDSFGADFWRTYYRTLETLDVNSLSLENMPGSFRDQRVPNFDRVDPLIKPTYQDSTSAGIEYQLSGTSVLRAYYVHNDLRQVIDDVGALVNGNNVFSIANPGEGNARPMPTTGPTSPFPTPKVKRIYDAFGLGIARRHLDVLGRLATDRPHVVKL